MHGTPAFSEGVADDKGKGRGSCKAKTVSAVTLQDPRPVSFQGLSLPTYGKGMPSPTSLLIQINKTSLVQGAFALTKSGIIQHRELTSGYDEAKLICADLDRSSVQNITGQNKLGQRVLQTALDHPL